jgi:uncharacterized membrane protein
MKYKINMQFILLGLASIFSTILLVYRIEILGITEPISFSWEDPNFIDLPKGTMLFLVWNLILAWIPYLAALAIQPIYNIIKSKVVIFFILMIWLFFFPNAPYIITDFVHLKKRIDLPFWYDITILSSFAGIGLMLGLLSLLKVEKFLTAHLDTWKAKLISLSTIPLCGLGIWIGRYQRWNTWDILTRPDMLLMDIYLQMKDPIANMDTLGLSIVITIMLLFSYFFLQSFISQTDTGKSNF